MPENQVTVAGGIQAQDQQQQNQAGGGWGMVKSLAYRMMIIYFVSSMVKNWRNSPSTVQNVTNEVGNSAAPTPSHNLFAKNQKFDIYVYLSPFDRRFVDFGDTPALFWKEEGLTYGDWTSGPNGDGSISKSQTIACPIELHRNASYYVHIFILKSGNSPDPVHPHYTKHGIIYNSRRLNKFKRKYYRKTQNLLTGETTTSVEDQRKAQEVGQEILSHWHPNLTINLIDDHSPWQKGSLPSPLDEAVRFDPISGDYYPIFFFNDYWNLASEYLPLNSTVEKLNLTITYAPMSLFKWQLYTSQQMRGQWAKMMGGELLEGNDDDQDSLKLAILETNPWLLGITIVVSLLHTVFELLAFKNDIQFWRSRDSLQGLSVRSVLFSVFTSLIVFLYICDNDTNFVVKCSIFVGLLIELWKVPKCMDVGIDKSRPVFGFIPRITIADKGSYIQSSTRKYDQLAFKYLSWLLYPLLFGYAIYSLIYVEQKGWYNWMLSMLYGFLLMFGFIMMTPQLFINYKLKSVAHLPWRMLSYKFINTFIDDLFAFVIRMPTMYRIGCFRDDIVFLVYLYQRWIYTVDPTRRNEYGSSMIDSNEGKASMEVVGEQQLVLADQADEQQLVLADQADEQQLVLADQADEQQLLLGDEADEHQFVPCETKKDK